MKDQVAPFLVGYSTVGIFRVFPDVKFDDQTLIFRSVCIFLQGVGQILVAYDICETSVCRSMQVLLEKTFHVCCPSFVEPEVCGVCMAAGDYIELDCEQDPAASART